MEKIFHSLGVAGVVSAVSKYGVHEMLKIYAKLVYY